MSLLVTIIGFAGGLAVLGSFAGSASGRLDPRGRGYHALNAGGAVALIASGFAAGAWPSVGVNSVWALISLASLAAAARATRAAKAPVDFLPPTAEMTVAKPRRRASTVPTVSFGLPSTIGR